MKVARVSMLASAVALMLWAAMPSDAWAGGGCAKAKAESAQGGCACNQTKDCGCQGKGDCAGCAEKQTAAAQAPRAFDQAPAVGTKATCPVMGGEFTVAADTPRSVHQGKHYAFCCSGCKPKFDKDPGKYAVK